MILIYSPDGSNACGSRGGKFEGTESAYGLKVAKIAFLLALPIHVFINYDTSFSLIAQRHRPTDDCVIVLNCEQLDKMPCYRRQDRAMPL